MRKSVRHFKEMGLKETNVRNWRNAYQTTLAKNAQPVEAIVIKALPGKTRGRHPLLGVNLAKKLQETK